MNKSSEQNRIQREQRKTAVAAVLALILLMAAALVWHYRDRFSRDRLVTVVQTLSGSEYEGSEAFTYDSGSNQIFARCGEGLAIATGSGFELLDGDGLPVAGKITGLESPAVTTGDDRAVFYSIGSSTLYVADMDGTVSSLEADGPVISADLSDSGHLTVVCETSGYRAAVCVYDSALFLSYRWSSASAWVSDARVSPDGRRLAVLSYTAEGSEVRLFLLSRDELINTFSVSGKVLFRLHWFSGSALCCFDSSEVLFFSSSGQWTGTYGFGDLYLTDLCTDGSGFVCLALSPYLSGSSGTLVTLNASGDELGTAAYDSELLSLTAYGSEVAELCSDGLTLRSSSLNEKAHTSDTAGFRRVYLRARGEALLVGPTSAEVFRF